VLDHQAPGELRERDRQREAGGRLKAVAQEEYGPPEALELREVERPAVGADEVLVRVHTTSVNPADWHFMRGEPRIMRVQAGLRRPKVAVLGCELAGVVEEAGAGATHQPGDEVFGCTFMRGFGGFAEYASAPDELMAAKPVGLPFDQAAVVPMAGQTALQGLRDHAPVEPGDGVMIIGAGGGVGTLAVQIAKHFGGEVTGVCSTEKAELVRSLGADHVIDYGQEDLAAREERYDVIFQLAGTHSPSELRRLLTERGTLLVSSGESDGRWVGPIWNSVKASLLSPVVSQRLTSFTMKPSREDLETLSELIEIGALSPVIDRNYALAEVPEAIRHLEEGHARGKVLVTL
jgi:NADPH:quinone reductase-like Zn-dependent oxidoreductase